MENKDKPKKPKQPEEKVKMSDFKFFMKELEYNYPVNYPPLDFKGISEECLTYLKKEILDNLINLANDDRKPYLNRLKFEFEENLKRCWATQEMLNKWYEKYNTNEEDALNDRTFNNPIFIILSDEPPKFKESFEKGFNFDTEPMQNDFYNFFFGKILRDALDFIQLQVAEYSITTADPQTIIRKEIHYNDSPTAPHSIDVNDFFKKIEYLEITKIQIHNTVEKITNNFELEKLKILLGDFEFYMFLSTEDKEAEYSIDDVFKEIDEWKKRGKEIPYRTIFAPVKNAEGKWEKQKQEDKFIDKEKLLYPYHYFSCYEFKALLIDEINKKTMPPEPPAKKTTTGKHQSFKYIGKTSEQEKITYLFNDLKTLKLIDKDTELKTFRKIFSGETIEAPIVWTGNPSELYYFIKQLHSVQKKVIDLKQKQWEVTTLCFIYPKGIAIDRSKLKGLKNPASAKEIEKAVKSL